MLINDAMLREFYFKDIGAIQFYGNDAKDLWQTASYKTVNEHQCYSPHSSCMRVRKPSCTKHVPSFTSLSACKKHQH